MVGGHARAGRPSKGPNGMTTTRETPPRQRADAQSTDGQTPAHAVQDALEEALKSPAGDPIPHPALDREPETQGSDKDGLDKVVFGISAVVAVAFLLWGMISTRTLSSASGDAL